MNETRRRLNQSFEGKLALQQQNAEKARLES